MHKQATGGLICLTCSAVGGFTAGYRVFGQMLPQCRQALVGSTGYSVAVSGDTAITSAPGSALVFRWNGANWAQEAQLIAPDDQYGNNEFGATVAIHRDLVVCGARYDDDRGSDAGAIYVFRRQGTTWTFEAKVTAEDGHSYDSFGEAAAVDENLLVVGARGAGSQGAGYVLRRTSQGWIQESKLTPWDASTVGDFGSSVAIDGNRIVVGTWHDDLRRLGCPSGYCDFGSAYVFRFDGTTWKPEQKLIASPPVLFERFGMSVAIHGEKMLVGTIPVYEQSGAAYAFVLDGALWRQEHRFGSSAEGFGRSVALTDGFALVAAQHGADLFRYDDQTRAWPELPQASLLAPGGSYWASLALDSTNALIGFIGNPAYAFSFGGTPDENLNQIDDVCEADCNANGIADASEIASGASADCDANGVPDQCEPDCNANGIVDVCELVALQVPDCNHNGVPDSCDISAGTSEDCAANGIPDECEPDCNANARSDICETSDGTTEDCSGNHIPDACESDCNGNAVADSCDVFFGTSPDIDADGVPDECETWSQCVSDGGHFDYSPHRSDAQAEFLAMLISGELRAPDAEYNRIVRDLALLNSAYPILRSVDRVLCGCDQMLVGVYSAVPLSGFDALNSFFQVVDDRRFSFDPDVHLLTFCDSLNIAVLKRDYEALPEVDYVCGGADSGYNGNGDYVNLTVESDQYVYEFSNGEGDCMSGCYCRQTWRFAVTPSGSITLLEYDPGPCGCGDHPYVLPNDGDFDSDGVIDCLDPCAAGEDPGPIDSDGDGVGDLCDACAHSIPGVSVDATGCPPRAPGDIDRDGDVALDDFVVIRNCFFVPTVNQCTNNRAVHLDADWDVDLADFAIFQRCFSGADVPADAACDH